MEELEAYAQTFFRDIPNTGNAKADIAVPLVSDSEKAKFITIDPIKEVRKLTLSFTLPAVDKFYRQKPLSYIAHLLGNEGSGSLMSLLKTRGFINTLAAGGGVSGSNFREFTVSLNLTPKGLDHIDEIVQTVFQYIELIRQQGLDEWRFAERNQYWIWRSATKRKTARSIRSVTLS